MTGTTLGMLAALAYYCAMCCLRPRGTSLSDDNLRFWSAVSGAIAFAVVVGVLGAAAS